MVITEEMKQKYIDDVYMELERHGVYEDMIPKVVGKTGFLSTMEKYAEEQFHYSAEDAAIEILVTAACR